MMEAAADFWVLDERDQPQPFGNDQFAWASARAFTYPSGHVAEDTVYGRTVYTEFHGSWINHSKVLGCLDHRTTWTTTLYGPLQFVWDSPDRASAERTHEVALWLTRLLGFIWRIEDTLRVFTGEAAAVEEGDGDDDW